MDLVLLGALWGASFLFLRIATPEFGPVPIIFVRVGVAAVLLGVGRAVGETMAVLMATGHAVNIPHSIFDSVRTLTATIAAELGETAQGSDHYRVLFLIGVLLFSITFVVNLTADLIVRGIRKK